MSPPGGSSPPSGLPSCSAAMESLCLVRLECTSANHCETGSWWTSSEGPVGCRWGGGGGGGGGGRKVEEYFNLHLPPHVSIHHCLGH